MGSVAREASFIRFDWRMLKDEWPHGVGVALGANRKLSGRRADLTAALGAVRVMAVTALNQAHFHTMAIWPCKLRLLRRVAAQAKLRLRLHEHEVNIGRFMWAVAAGATNSAG